jgi:hypothetical protein
MREIRQSGSEGGGAGEPALPTPIFVPTMARICRIGADPEPVHRINEEERSDFFPTKERSLWVLRTLP